MPEGFEQLALNWRSALTGSVMVCGSLAAVFLLRRRVEPLASLALAAFIACAFLAAVPTLIGFAGAYDIWPGLTFLPTQTFLLLGPLIALHAHALMIGPPNRAHLWWLAPGVVYWFYQLWAFTMLGEAEAKWAYIRAIDAPFVFPVVTAATWALLLGSVIYVFALRRRYLVWLIDNHADSEPFDPTWLAHLVWIMGGASLYWIVKSALSIWYAFDYFESFWWDFAGMFLVFIIALEALAGIHQSFPKMVEMSSSSEDVEEPIPARDWVAEGARVRKSVIDHQWFLEPGLSLQILSRRLGMNHVYVSRAINDGVGCNFNGFINQLRVEHAKRLIEERDPRSLTEIALASGFGSKASFNRAFALYAKTSPSAYRKSRVST